MRKTALDKLLGDTFASLEPADLNHPVPTSEVKALIERVALGLAK